MFSNSGDNAKVLVCQVPSKKKCSSLPSQVNENVGCLDNGFFFILSCFTGPVNLLFLSFQCLYFSCNFGR